MALSLILPSKILFPFFSQFSLFSSWQEWREKWLEERSKKREAETAARVASYGGRPSGKEIFLKQSRNDDNLAHAALAGPVSGAIDASLFQEEIFSDDDE